MHGESFPEAADILLERGPFPNTVDPWVEAGHYFHPLHESMIDQLMSQLQRPARRLGYLVGRETSLQIAEGTQPDLYIDQPGSIPRLYPDWDYTLAAEEVLAEPGILVQEAATTSALHITEIGTGSLITIVELVSPGNKTELRLMGYRMRRSRLLYEKGINIVEIDLTRSVKHLLATENTRYCAYHAAVYLPHEMPRLIAMHYGQPLKRIAIPLRGSALPVELQAAYDGAYQLNASAAHLRAAQRYTEAHLPFPSTLTDDQRREAVAAVAEWEQQLNDLRKI